MYFDHQQAKRLKRFGLLLFCAVQTLGAVDIKDNRVDFEYYNKETVKLKAVTGVDLSGLAHIPANQCPGSYYGIATDHQAVDHDTMYTDNQIATFISETDGTKHGYTCIKGTDIYLRDDHEFALYAGRANSETAANFYRGLVGGNPSADWDGSVAGDDDNISSLILLSNVKAFKKEDGQLTDGFPDGLNFAFVVDLTFSIEDENGSTEELVCSNMAFGQQGVDGFRQHWATKLAKQGAQLGVDGLEIVGSDGGDVEADGELVDSFVKDIKTDVKDLVKQLANMKNVWWMGQLYHDSQDNVNVVFTDGEMPSKNLPEGQYQHVFKCSNNYVMMTTEDTHSDYTYKVEFLKYHY